eukprot:jgi/Mesen1/5029/ME000025S04436
MSIDVIPVIDLTYLHDSDKSKSEQVIKAVGRACEEWGFFQVVNHGVSIQQFEVLKEQAAAFFSLPLEQKRLVKRSFRNCFGYYDSELTKNVRDWKEVFDVTFKPHPELPDDDPANQTLDGWNQFPDGLPAFRSAVQAWYNAVERLALDLLGAVSQSLGLPATFFHKHFEKHMSLMRLNNYPVCPDPSRILGVSRHKDAAALTVLVQDDVGGLQVRAKNGAWLGVKPERGAFVINLGDMFQVWSNDKYESVEHRVVVNENRQRFSVPFFLSPSYDTNYCPAAPLLNDDNTPRYKSINWGEFSRKRNEGNFADYGEEVQIHHYKIDCP